MSDPSLIDATEYKKIGEACKEAREYADNIIASMADALLVVSADGNIQSFNQATCNLLSLKGEALQGESIDTIFSAEALRRQFRRILKKGPVLNFETTFISGTGERIPVNISGSVIYNEEKKLQRFILVARDIRPRLAMETALKESEEKYRKLVESSADCIHMIDTEGRFVHINRAGLRLNCLKHEKEILGKSYQKMVHKKYEHVVAEAIQKVLKGETASFHYETTSPNGDHKWWDSNLVPIRCSDGKIVNMVGISRDVTEQRQSSKTIEFLREYASNIVANLPISILIVDRNFHISFTNEYFLKKMGKDQTQAVGKSLEAVLGSTYIANLELNKKIKTVFQIKEALPKERFQFKERTYDYQILPFREQIGRRHGAMLVIEDVTTMVSLEEQVRHSEKMAAVGQFTAGVIHEVNNPLCVVLGNVQYLLDHFHDLDFSKHQAAENLFQTLQVIDEEARRCGEIVANLLHFSHKGKIDKKQVQINHVVRRMAQMLEHQLQLSKIKPVFDLASKLPPVEGDANLLQQVFVNLGLNAQHAMSRGGTLSVKTSLNEAGWIQIIFKDTGPGIPKKYLNRIFEPFFTTQKAGKGTGLGLSVVHSIIEEHGGHIAAESMRRKGAVFKIRLPVAKKQGLLGKWGLR